MIYSSHLRAMGRHLPWDHTVLYLPPQTSEYLPPNPSQTSWYSINLPRRDGRPSWPRWLGTGTYRLTTDTVCLPTVSHPSKQ